MFDKDKKVCYGHCTSHMVGARWDIPDVCKPRHEFQIYQARARATDTLTLCVTCCTARDRFSFRSTANGWRSDWPLVEASSTLAETMAVGRAINVQARGGGGCGLRTSAASLASFSISTHWPLVEAAATSGRWSSHWPPSTLQCRLTTLASSKAYRSQVSGQNALGIEDGPLVEPLASTRRPHAGRWSSH